MIHARNISFRYPHSSQVFSDFSWNVEKGEKWAILGPSGCGKTTLLYLLAGLISPDQGEIRVEDQLLLRPRPGTGVILQDYGLLPWFTVRENINLGANVRSFYGADGKHSPKNRQNPIDIDHWLLRLGIIDIADKYPTTISGGQRQRTAIARTLALSPDLLLMDEPFSSLDAITREDLQALTLQLCSEQQITMVLVTHSIEEAACLGKKILLLGKYGKDQIRYFDNPEAGKLGYIQSPDYQSICMILHHAMEEQ